MDTNEQQPITSPSNSKSTLLWVVIIVLVLVVIAAAVYIFGLKKSDSSKDLAMQTEDSITGDDASSSSKKPAKEEEFLWSKMDKGPYHDSISYATGVSLTSWKDSDKVLAEHASVPDVLLKEGVLYIYFVDVSEDGKPEQIGLLKSSDNGTTWGQKQIINISGLGSKIAVDPAPYLMEDGRIRLYYFDISTTKTEGLQNNAIYSAISDDGVNFTQETGTRFKYPAIFDPCVIKIGDVWRMYVGTDDQKVLSATSSDGLIFDYEGVALTGGAIPNVVYENGTYYLFTGGIDISTSKDGKTFTKTSSRFDSGALTADPGVVKLGDKNYFMTYKTKPLETAVGPAPEDQ